MVKMISEWRSMNSYRKRKVGGSRMAMGRVGCGWSKTHPLYTHHIYLHPPITTPMGEISHPHPHPLGTRWVHHGIWWIWIWWRYIKQYNRIQSWKS
jgi:hypothetical protein